MIKIIRSDFEARVPWQTLKEGDTFVFVEGACGGNQSDDPRLRTSHGYVNLLSGQTMGTGHIDYPAIKIECELIIKKGAI